MSFFPPSTTTPTRSTAALSPSHFVRLENIRRAYLRLGTGELAAAIVFAGVAAIQVAPRLERTVQIGMWLILAPLLAVLVQAGVFWLLARSWVGLRPMPRALARLFAGLGGLNVILLGLGLVAMMMVEVSAGVRVLFMGIWVFGLVETINYFVVRLAYPAGSWFAEVGRWRTPRLLADIRAGLQAKSS